MTVTVSDRLKAIELIADWDIKRVTPQMVEFVLSVAKSNVDEEKQPDQQQEDKKSLLDDHFFLSQAEETKIHRNQYINHHADNNTTTTKSGYTSRAKHECPHCHEFYNGKGFRVHVRFCKKNPDRPDHIEQYSGLKSNPGGETKNAPITAQSFGEFAAKMDAAKRTNTLTFPEKH